jgi:16S rRNA (cytosine967-C5)-methyltransferase
MQNNNNLSTRLVASQVINKVTNGASLADVVEPALAYFSDPRDRSFIQAVCYGVCRYYARLDYLLSQLLKKPMHEKDADVHALLLVGLYQLSEMRVPTHAAVSETVNAAALFSKKPWARGLANAILREYLRRDSELKEKIKTDPEANFAHPAWWVAAIKKSWPDQWEKILAANNEHPPFVLRANQQKISRHLYLEKLTDAKIIPETHNGIVLALPVAVEKLPGFAAGEVTVQDGAAQLAAELLELHNEQRVLDACAAPGGKLTHIIEIKPHISEVVAIEVDQKRCAAINENLLRLHAEAKVTVLNEDVANTKKWFDGTAFDRILLDAPCSASGVIRRHPDIKLLRQPNDIKTLAKEQRRLLDALWPLLKSGGLLLYATCSIFPQENTEVLQGFLAAHPDAQEEKIDAEWGLPCAIGRQILPGMHGMDGFYYAKLKKML